MASLGQELREEREARHISIAEIASATKIVTRYLEALEADHLKIMPGEFFIKGIIRNYARAIGLDGEIVLAKYKAAGLIGEPEPKRHLLSRSEPALSGGEARKPAAEPAVQLVFKAPFEPPPPPIQQPAPEPAQGPVPKLPPERPIQPAPKPGPASAPPERLIVKSAPEAPRPSRLKLALATVLRTRAVVWTALGTFVVLAVVFLIVLPMLRRPPRATVQATTQAPPVSAQPLSPPVQEPKAEPPPVVEVAWKGVTIEIAFEAETWIQIYADGVLKVDGLFLPGTTAKAQADQRILIHTGNAGGFGFLLNGKPAKPLGRSGQVLTDIAITPDNFKDFLEAETPARPAG
jgi:transcriptional regulator with XRE-family HTH domain